jgi:acyl carrier protein
MSTVDQVRKVAKEAGILLNTGALRPMDSLALIDLIVALENTFSVSFPLDQVLPEHFASLEAIAKLVENVQQLRAKSA